LQIVLGHLFLGDLGCVKDVIDDLVLEDRRLNLLAELRVLLGNSKTDALDRDTWRA